MEVDGVNLAVGGGAVTAIAGVVGAWIKAKFGKTQIPQPMETQQVGPFVTCGECKQHRAAIGKRIDTRAEQRSENLHRRLDPIIEKVAANSAKVEMMDAVIRDAAKSAAVGGKK